MKLLVKYFFIFGITLTSTLGLADETNDIIKETAIDHQIHCPEGQCPEGIGTMVTLGMMGREFCRVFLIDETTAITNAHCLYAIINEGITENKSCIGEASIKFGNGEIANCKNLKFSNYTESDISSPDVAIIELEQPVKTQPLRLKRVPFSDEQSLYYFKSSYSFETNSSEMKRVDCRTKKYSSAAGAFFTDRPVTVSMSDCPFDYGDSGSPIFNESGSVVAILQGGLPVEALDAFKKITLPAFENISYMDVLKKYSLENNVDFKPIISATTMTCLDRQEIPGELNCKAMTLKEYMADLLKTVFEDRRSAMMSLQKDFPGLEVLIPEDSFKQMLRDVKVNEMKPEDMLTPTDMIVDCSKVNRSVSLPKMKIRSSNDSYFRISLILEYEIKEFCDK